jgi:hypothetical protein
MLPLGLSPDEDNATGGDGMRDERSRATRRSASMPHGYSGCIPQKVSLPTRLESGATKNALRRSRHRVARPNERKQHITVGREVWRGDLNRSWAATADSPPEIS